MPSTRIKILEKTCSQKKPCWQTKGNVWLSEWYQHPPPITSPIQVYEVRLFELAVIGTILWKTRVNDISTNNQLMWSSTVRASSCRHYLICVIKNNKDTGTGKLGKLCSGKKASRRKWKSENETENPNTSYLAIITEK